MQDKNSKTINDILSRFHQNNSWGEIKIKIKDGKIYLIEEIKQIKPE